MNKRILPLFVGIVLCLLPQLPASAQETVFANYFDIGMDSPAGTEVIGRIHLERNKDVRTRPIPEGYRFEIVKQPEGELFSIDTKYDPSKRIMGVLSVAKGKSTGSQPATHRLVVALKDGNKLIEKFNITVRVVRKTLWSTFNERYTPTVINNARMYGKVKYSDDEIANSLLELKRNNWCFEGEKCYNGRPQDYLDTPKSKDDHWAGGSIEYDWMKVANRIGGLGHAYATSKVYGPQGDPQKRAELREALYQALLAYTKSVTIEGTDVEIDGKPIGNCTGDGFSLLEHHKLAGHQIATHQWVMTDPLIVPILNLMPDLLKGMQDDDETCVAVHDALIRYFQVFTSIVKGRRAIDNPNERWGEIQDTLYSSGAWADANLGHRSRTMLALPIIWADYNRPMTYVQYWYKDFYQDKPFKGFSFSPGWSPNGVASDVAYWMTKYNIPAHKYIQSGFQPDGTISHHTGQGTDAAMVAYGFEWLTDCNMGYQYFKDTRFEVPGSYLQFQLDRLLLVYPKLIYKQHMDFLVAGRAYLEDSKRFATKTYPNAINHLLKARSKKTQLRGVEELKAMQKLQKTNAYEYSGTDAYWVNEYLVHRRGANEPPFYASLKLKSERTVGAEDFSKVRKSWHLGSGILQLKVRGDEYADFVLKNYDWHAIPGLTEEWRTDALPAKGGAQASLPGLNKVSGVLADGKAGMGIYHHLPKEKYSSAKAFKTYHFVEDNVVALGSGIARNRKGQQQEIATFIDQSAFNNILTWCIDGKVAEASPGESINLSESFNSICWLHQGEKGYVILPTKKLQLRIKTGAEVNTTDPKIANKKPNFIIAVNHGATPGQEWDNSYCYVLLPNVSKEKMPERAKAIASEWEFKQQAGVAHAVYSAKDKTWQYAFFQPGTLAVGNVEVASQDIAQVMLRDNGDSWTLSINNPAPDGQKQALTFTISTRLPQGTYNYRAGGIYPMEGETVTIASDSKGSRVTVEIPDGRDAVRYNYQSDLYAATPVVVTIPKK